MNVAAFFRDVRVSKALSDATPSQAESLVSGFLLRHNYGDCNGAQLLALGDLAVRSQQHDVARQALAHAAGLEPSRAMALYKLGRVELAVRDFAEAAAQFLAATEADPSFPHSWIGAARALLAIDETARAAECAERFAAFGVAPKVKADTDILAPLADYLFEQGHSGRAMPMYAYLAQHGTPSSRSTMRLGECMCAAQDYVAALAVLRPLNADGTLTPGGRRAYAISLSYCGEHKEAAAEAETAWRARPDHDGFLAVYVEVLARGGDAALIGDALARHADAFGQYAIELQASLHLEAGNAAAAAALLLGAQIEAGTRLFHLCFRTAYAALRDGAGPLALQLADKLDEAAAGGTKLVTLRLDALFQAQRWEDAGAVLAALAPDQADSPHVRLKLFELACFTGQAAEAAAIWAGLESHGLPDRKFMLPRLRFLAEQKQWDAVLDAALPWLDAEFSWQQIGYVLFRAARHTGRHGDIVGAVEAIAGWAALPGLARLHATLKLDEAATLDDFSAALGHAAVTEGGALRARAHACRAVLAGAAPAGGRRALFLCTDRAYLCATLVALHMAVQRVDKSSTDIFVVVDDELKRSVTGFVRGYKQAGYSVKIVPASEVIDSAKNLYPGYGLFTSGHALAAAAYYRIFFARHLARLGLHDRAAYIDGDIVLRQPLAPLFAAEMHGQPLAARPETDRPEIRRAIALHGLDAGSYFNSGVLLFDMKHPGLEAALDRAVSAIGDGRTTLLFHDQCALNIGFRNAVTPLGTAWNFPIGEATAPAAIPDNVALLHFLDRPKPWSAAYGGACGKLWLAAWVDLAIAIGGDAAFELLGMSAE